MKLGFIGTGNMASAIMGGVINKGLFKADEIIGADVFAPGRERAKEQFGIHVTADNKEVVKNAEVIILSVKPQFYADVIAGIKDEVTEDKIIITIAPGKTLSWLSEQFGKAVKIVRTMPNTPAMVGEGMTAACPNEHMTQEGIARVKEILESFSKVACSGKTYGCCDGGKRQLSGLCVYVYRGYGGRSRIRRYAESAGLSVRGAGSSWKCQDGNRYRKASGRA